MPCTRFPGPEAQALAVGCLGDLAQRLPWVRQSLRKNLQPVLCMLWLTPACAGRQGKGMSGPRVQELAVACLGDFAEASLVNCGKIAAVSGGPVLADIASVAVHDRHRHQLEAQLTRLMSILAQDCPIRYIRTLSDVQIFLCILSLARLFLISMYMREPFHTFTCKTASINLSSVQGHS